MGSFLCLPARGAFVTSTSLLHLHSSCRDECTEKEDQAQWSTARQRADSASVFLALRSKPWVWVLSWHATATINSFLALGNNGFGPKRFAKRSIASISGITAATLWLTALARNVGGRKNLAERQGTDGRALTRTRAWLPGKYHLGICIRNPVLSTRRDTLTSFNSDSFCACSSCCRAGPPSLLLATLGEQILTIFFVSTHKDQWFCAKRYLILGSITS